MKLKRYRKVIVKLVVAVLILILLYIVLSTGSSNNKSIKVTNISKIWEYDIDTDNLTATLTTEFTSTMLGKSLEFYTLDGFVKAYINDKEIYSCGEYSNLSKSPGASWQIIELGNDISNVSEDIKIVIQYTYLNKLNTVYDIYLGYSGDIIKLLVGSEKIDIITCLFLFILGIFIITFFIISNQNGVSNKQNLFLGKLSILIAMWSISDMFVCQLLVSSGIIRYYLYYISFMVIPLVIMAYIENLNSKCNLTYEITAHSFIIVILTLIQILGIKEYTETLILYLSIISIEAIIIIIKLIKYKMYTFNKIDLISVPILLITMVINIVVFLLNTDKKAPIIITKIGFIVFLLIQIYCIMEGFMATLISIRDTKITSEIAYKDALTDTGNRYAFDRDIKTVPIKYLCLTSLDINNLKYYNDKYGHSCGDYLIKESANIIKSVYGSGSVYRTGGDEFVVIQASINPDGQLYKRNQLMKAINEYNDLGENKFIIEIACGDSAYRYGDFSYEDILKRSDKKMYEHKAELKKQSKLVKERNM